MREVALFQMGELVFFGNMAKGAAINVEHQKDGPLWTEWIGTQYLF